MRFLSAITCCLLAGSTLQAEMIVTSDCEMVEVVTASPDSRGIAQRVASLVCRQLVRLGRLYGHKPKEVKIRICKDLQEFKSRSGRDWFIGAALNGHEIVTQPARLLARMKDLQQTLTHELSHLMVSRLAGRNCPRWLDEGLAQWLAGQKSGLTEVKTKDAPVTRAELTELERVLRLSSADKSRLGHAYKTSLLLVDMLISRVGLEDLLAALPQLKKVPEAIEIKVSGRTLAAWLFETGD